MDAARRRLRNDPLFGFNLSPNLKAQGQDGISQCFRLFKSFTFRFGILHLAVLHLNSLDMNTLNSRPSVMDTGVEAPRRDELIPEHPRASVLEPRRMGLMNTQCAGKLRRGW